MQNDSVIDICTYLSYDNPFEQFPIVWNNMFFSILDLYKLVLRSHCALNSICMQIRVFN